MSTMSINEPGSSVLVSSTPPSVNEPPTTTPSVPAISSLSPNTCAMNAASLTVTITGTNFGASTKVYVDGKLRTSALVNGTTMTTVISPGPPPRTVFFQAMNVDKASNRQPFTFTTTREGADEPVEDAPEATPPPSSHAHTVDPDELEDEIDEAIEEGDAFKPTHHNHRGTVSRTLPNKRKR